MTGCGCLFLVALLAALLYVFIAGSTDAGEPVAEIVALAMLLVATRQAATAGRRRSIPAARS